MSEKPEWWPENPYPINVFPMLIEEFPELVPDAVLRTKIAGCLCRYFWQTASNEILKRYWENEGRLDISDKEDPPIVAMDRLEDNA